MLRVATPADASGILEIYAPYIRQTSLTFETNVPAVSAFSARIRQYTEEFPWIVLEEDGTILGYAYASRYRERIAYQWSVEASIYIHPDHHGKGIGKRLYTTLFELLKWQGFRNVYAVINLPNPESVSFHEKMGFEYFATYEQVGYKLGQWKDVGWWRLKINEFILEPEPPVNFPDLPFEQINELLTGS